MASRSVPEPLLLASSALLRPHSFSSAFAVLARPHPCAIRQHGRLEVVSYLESKAFSVVAMLIIVSQASSA
jgi:hypothetical protein